MSEQPKNQKRNRLLAGAATAAVAIAAIGVSREIDGKTVDSMTAKESLIIQTGKLAHANAEAFTAKLYDKAQYPKGVPMPTIKGEIRVTVKTISGTHTGSYKDPILLATLDPSALPDKAGHFLEGGWIGVQGNDSNNKATITAVPYNRDTDTFVPYDAAHIMFPSTVGAYVSVSKGAINYSIDGIYSYDMAGNSTISNPDGTAVRPGLSTGMK